MERSSWCYNKGNPIGLSVLLSIRLITFQGCFMIQSKVEHSPSRLLFENNQNFWFCQFKERSNSITCHRYGKEQLVLPYARMRQKYNFQWKGWPAVRLAVGPKLRIFSLIFPACSVGEIWWKFPLEIILLPHSGRGLRQLLQYCFQYLREAFYLANTNHVFIFNYFSIDSQENEIKWTQHSIAWNFKHLVTMPATMKELPHNQQFKCEAVWKKMLL